MNKPRYGPVFLGRSRILGWRVAVQRVENEGQLTRMRGTVRVLGPQRRRNVIEKILEDGTTPLCKCRNALVYKDCTVLRG